ncbi:MAG TPA: MlaD family protein [Oleiagrimonas sp.]|nr:MlaD family protein [Oleiagrimonas sp.]
MENRTHAIIAICFLVVLCIAAGIVFFWLSSGPSEPLAYRIVTRDSVAGLAPQSKVEFKGLTVGHVERIHFDPHDRSKVVIDLRVRRGTYITHATYATLATQGLTGGKTLELKLDGNDTTPLPTSSDHPALIPLRKGFLARLQESAQQDMQDIHAILDSVKKVLDADNREHIAASIRQIDTATAKLVAIEKQLMPAMKQMPALAQSARKSLKQSHALLTSANALAKEARGQIKKVGKASDSVQHLTRKLDRQTAPDIDALSQSLMRTSRQLQELLRELKAKPQSLIFGPPEHPPGPGEPGFHAPEQGAHNQGDSHE